MISAVINNIEKYYKELKNRTFLEKYRKKSMLNGKKIFVMKGDEAIPATALDIDGDCRLLVEFEDKTRDFLSSGEVGIKLN